MTEQLNPPDSPSSGQIRWHWSMSVVALGVIAELLPLVPGTGSVLGEQFALPVGIVLSGLGVAALARGYGRPVWFGLMAVVPVFGPLIGVYAIVQNARANARAFFWVAAVFLAGGSLIAGPTAGVILCALAVLGALEAIRLSPRRFWLPGLCMVGIAVAQGVTVYDDSVFSPAHLERLRQARQDEARVNLGRMYVEEKAFYARHKRYGTFEEIRFAIPGNTNRYTYRIDRSGKPDTIIPAGDGVATPENTVVQAGLSPDGQHFTATAARNIDTDATIDQWHVNDLKQGLERADVDDVNE